MSSSYGPRSSASGNMCELNALALSTFSEKACNLTSWRGNANASIGDAREQHPAHSSRTLTTVVNTDTATVSDASVDIATVVPFFLHCSIRAACSPENRQHSHHRATVPMAEPCSLWGCDVCTLACWLFGLCWGLMACGMLFGMIGTLA